MHSAICSLCIRAARGHTKYAIFPGFLFSLCLSSCAFRFSIVLFARSSLKNVPGGFILQAALRISSFCLCKQSRKRHTMVLGHVLIPSAAPSLDLVPVRCARSITSSKLKGSFSLKQFLRLCFSIQPGLVMPSIHPSTRSAPNIGGSC